MSSHKKIFFKGHTFLIEDEVYEPAEDTFLLAENIRVGEDEVVLDMGTGCGILGILAAEKALKVVAVDINPHAIRCATRNALRHHVAGRMQIKRSDLFSSVHEERFNLILFNAPYLPTLLEEQRSWLSKAWDGGLNGRTVIDKFTGEAPEYLRESGKILLAQSTLTDVRETLSNLRNAGLKSTIIAHKNLHFETIVIIRAQHYKGI